MLVDDVEFAWAADNGYGIVIVRSRKVITIRNGKRRGVNSVKMVCSLSGQPLRLYRTRGKSAVVLLKSR